MSNTPPEALRVCAIGDVMGKAGRNYLHKKLPLLKEKFQPDLIIANGENVAGGFGITPKIFQQMTEHWGIDVVTTGNHWMDKKEIRQILPASRLLQPANMHNVSEISQGYCLWEGSEVTCAVINLLGRSFMKGDNNCPFKTFDTIMSRLPNNIKIIIVDFHAETSSEKQAFAHYVKDKVSLIYGTHTHCPTADERILNKAGFITDIGMTGAYDSVIGIKAEASLGRFIKRAKSKFEPATGDPWLCALICDINKRSGNCLAIQRLCWREPEFDVPGIAPT